MLVVNNNNIHKYTCIITIIHIQVIIVSHFTTVEMEIMYQQFIYSICVGYPSAKYYTDIYSQSRS